MTSFSDKSKRTLRQPCSVVFVVYPDIKLLDLAGPLQVFADAGEDSDGPGPYKISVASMAGGKVQTDTLVSIETEAMSHWRRRKIHTLIVVGGMGSKAAYRDQPFVREVAKLVRRSRRV